MESGIWSYSMGSNGIFWDFLSPPASGGSSKPAMSSIKKHCFDVLTLKPGLPWILPHIFWSFPLKPILSSSRNEILQYGNILNE